MSCIRFVWQSQRFRHQDISFEHDPEPQPSLYSLVLENSTLTPPGPSILPALSTNMPSPVLFTPPFPTSPTTPTWDNMYESNSPWRRAIDEGDFRHFRVYERRGAIAPSSLYIPDPQEFQDYERGTGGNAQHSYYNPRYWDSPPLSLNMPFGIGEMERRTSSTYSNYEPAEASLLSYDYPRSYSTALDTHSIYEANEAPLYNHNHPINQLMPPRIRNSHDPGVLGQFVGHNHPRRGSDAHSSFEPVETSLFGYNHSTTQNRNRISVDLEERESTSERMWQLPHPRPASLNSWSSFESEYVEVMIETANWLHRQGFDEELIENKMELWYEVER